MISKVLKVGDRIEMVPYSPADVHDERRVYNSQLLEIVSDYTVLVSVPIEASHLVPLEPGERYELRFITTAGIYICKSEIRERNKRGNIYFFEMRILSELQKDQRRQYFRLEKILPILYHSLTDEETYFLEMISQYGNADNSERRALMNRLRQTVAEEHDGTLSNISGGGIKFYSAFPLHKEDRIRMKIHIEELGTAPLDLFGRVVHSEEIPNRALKQEHRIEFFNINRDTREMIVKYVFSEERKQRQKVSGLF